MEGMKGIEQSQKHNFAEELFALQIESRGRGWRDDGAIDLLLADLTFPLPR